jgi:tRNA G18 (ribose-2'-O)-methylase SpoU
MTFDLSKQHKKCAEILKEIYEGVLSKTPSQELFEHYNELQNWMGLSPLTTYSLETISNHYHTHFKLAGHQSKEHNLLPTVRKGDKERAIRETGLVSVYLDHLRSAHNVGSIMRTMEAFSVGSLLLSEQTPGPENNQVQAASKGTYEWIKCKYIDSLDLLKGPVIALETSPDAISLYDFIFPLEYTLILGNEEYGCSEAALKRADLLLEIPLVGRKNSLNVANAFAIVVSEMQRQKGKL